MRKPAHPPVPSSSDAAPGTAVAVATPMPLDTPPLEALSGRAGSNRAQGPRQIAADTDRDALLAWLARSAHNANTLANCRRESERLLLWAMHALGKPLSSLTHEDLLRYRHFLSDPQPAERWVMAAGRKVARSHPDWRPFAGPLSASSQRQALVVLNAMFSWLVQAEYLNGNPLALSRQRKQAGAPRVVRLLEHDLWAQVQQSIQQMPVGTERERAARARVRWLFSLLFLCGLRISEVVGNRMGDVFCRADGAGTPRWWLEITGKGDKTRLVPATADLMAELSRYREGLGLSALPVEGEDTPLLLPVHWHADTGASLPEPLTRAAVHAIIKSVFQRAADAMAAAGGEAALARAAKLRAASAHWLRHTAGSRMADQAIDLRHVRDTLGHASLGTTSLYLHSEDDARHQAVGEGHTLRWS